MGATSLLAVAVIEGIEHDCEWEGCGERHSLEKLGEHMAKCLHRQVECPYLECRKRLPVSRLLEHSLQVGGISFQFLQVTSTLQN